MKQLDIINHVEDVQVRSWGVKFGAQLLHASRPQESNDDDDDDVLRHRSHMGIIVRIRRTILSVE